MYYIWSIIISIILFLLLQYNEYNKNKKNNINYEIFTLSNIGSFLIIYIIITIISYYISNNNQDIKNSIIGGCDNNKYEIINKNININPDVLKKIPDNIDIGFTPYE